MRMQFWKGLRPHSFSARLSFFFLLLCMWGRVCVPYANFTMKVYFSPFFLVVLSVRQRSRAEGNSSFFFRFCVCMFRAEISRAEISLTFFSFFFWCVFRAERSRADIKRFSCVYVCVFRADESSRKQSCFFFFFLRACGEVEPKF